MHFTGMLALNLGMGSGYSMVETLLSLCAAVAATSVALAFVARPVGTFVFMTVDRLYGRTAKLAIALFLLGGSTAAIAFLPGYATLGSTSIALLALFRLGQGFALGGSWDDRASK